AHGKAEALQKILQRRAFWGALLGGRQSHRDKGADHRKEAESVQQEAPAFGAFHAVAVQYGDGRAGNRRTKDTGTVENGRIEGDGVRQVVFAHHLNKKGLADGDVEGINDTNEEGHSDQLPYRDDAGEGQAAQEKGQKHRDALCPDHTAVAIVAVAYVTANGC